MADEESAVSIDEVKLWTVNALKDFLRARKLKLSGRKEELVARVFVALSDPELAPLATTADTASQQREEQYQRLLETSSTTLPDPRHLTDWESEAASIKKWPPLMEMDIGTFLSNIDDVSLRKRLISDYKDQKGYSYFSSGWMDEIFYHPISAESDHCFLKTKCNRSQLVKDIPWNVWVAVEKRSGEVTSAFCDCFAGLSKACNHVAALMFKVDYAWKHGLTNPACTSRECEWSGPSFAGKHSVQPRRVADMKWRKPKFHRQAPYEADGINPSMRRLFSPLGARSLGPTSTRESLMADLFKDFPDACCFEYMEQPGRDHVERDEPEDVAPTASGVLLPPPLPTLAATCSTTADFLAKLQPYPQNVIAHIEEITRGQATNEKWHLYRKGLITGSKAHSVLTKGRKLANSPDPCNVDVLVKNIVGEDSTVLDVPAVKYGRMMEDEARRAYTKDAKAHYSSVSVVESGLFISGDRPYLAASPDGLVSCSCCGEGVLEIKCPFSVAHEAPSVDNLDYLQKGSDGEVCLKRSHQYYTQVQAQLGVLRREWCDFFVYSTHGYLTVRVRFDANRWEELMRSAEVVFNGHVAEYMVRQGQKK